MNPVLLKHSCANKLALSWTQPSLGESATNCGSLGALNSLPRTTTRQHLTQTMVELYWKGDSSRKALNSTEMNFALFSFIIFVNFHSFFISFFLYFSFSCFYFFIFFCHISYFHLTIDYASFLLFFILLFCYVFSFFVTYFPFQFIILISFSSFFLFP